jgi:hypothetical protein
MPVLHFMPSLIPTAANSFGYSRLS